MGALVIVVAGLAVLLVAGIAAASPKGGEKSPPKKSKGDGDEKDGGGIDPSAAAGLLPGLGSGGALAGAAVLYTAANAFIGQKLTGDTLGGVTGGVLGLQGNAGNVGRVVGREVDQLVGGDVGGAAGTTAQAGGFFAGTAWAYVGWTAGVSVAIFAAFVYAIATVVSDLNALAFGQKGARDEYEKKWAEAERRFFDAIKAKGKDPATGKAFTSDVAIARFSWPMADGYMLHANELAYRIQMRKPRGAGVIEREHGRFWSERGKFAGSYGTYELPAQTPGAKAWSSDFAPMLVEFPATTKTITFWRPINYGWRLTLKSAADLPVEWKSGALQTIRPPSWVTASMLSGVPGREVIGSLRPPTWLNEPNGFGTVKVSHFYDVVVEPVLVEQTGVTDTLSEILMSAGARIANIDAWADWNKQAHGAFLGGLGSGNKLHANWGGEHGYFRGDVEGTDDDPVLVYLGKKFAVDGKSLDPIEVAPAPAPRARASLRAF